MGNVCRFEFFGHVQIFQTFSFGHLECQVIIPHLNRYYSTLQSRCYYRVSKDSLKEVLRITNSNKITKVFHNSFPSQITLSSSFN